ncbi:MAG TPA: DUF4157 domain-containing protein [Kofleriaceae bacterium]|nr:DUF4157 domain-containing protein [Kofleriaceae bacterium]
MSLPSPIMRKFEASLGADLSGVRVHTGAESQTAASAVGAKAYTMGQDIHFGAGQYDPSSGAGEHLLAHEVAHTVQQAGGTPQRQNKLEVSTPFDPAEYEADAAANAMVAGHGFQVGGGSGVQRKGYADPEPQEQSVVGVASHFDIPLPKVKIPIDFAEVELGGSISGEISGEEEEGEEKPSVEVGPTVGEHGIEPGAKWKITKERLLKLHGWSIKTKPAIAGVALNKKEAKAKLAGTLEVSNAAAPWLSVEAEVSLEVGAEWKDLKKKGLEGVQGAAMGIEITFSGEHTFEDGTKVKVGSSGSGKLKPNWKAIWEYLAEQAAEQGVSTAGETAVEGASGTSASDVAAGLLAAEVLIPAALITGGLLTIGAALWQIAQSDQFTELTEPEVQKCRAYCIGFAQGMRGQSMEGSEGVASGYAAGVARRNALSATAGASTVAASATSLDIYNDAWNKGWPPVRAKIEASYWDAHGFEKWFYGPEGSSTGFHVLKMLLDDWDRP